MGRTRLSEMQRRIGSPAVAPIQLCSECPSTLVPVHIVAAPNLTCVSVRSLPADTLVHRVWPAAGETPCPKWCLSAFFPFFFLFFFFFLSSQDGCLHRAAESSMSDFATKPFKETGTGAQRGWPSQQCPRGRGHEGWGRTRAPSHRSCRIHSSGDNHLLLSIYCKIKIAGKIGERASRNHQLDCKRIPVNPQCDPLYVYIYTSIYISLD